MITIRTATHFNQRQDDEWAIGRESNLIKCSYFRSVDGGTVLSEHHGKGLALVLFPSLPTPNANASQFELPSPGSRCCEGSALLCSKGGTERVDLTQGCYVAI